MEYNKDPTTWRQKMYEALRYKYHVIIPWMCEPPFKKGESKYSKWVYHNFVVPDLSDVTRSQYFFIRIDPGVLKGAGTISELSLAAFLNRHIVAVIDRVERKNLPGWMLGCLVKAHFVLNINSAIEYYKKLIPEGDK